VAEVVRLPSDTTLQDAADAFLDQQDLASLDPTYGAGDRR
jgi:hypothetical protein